MKKLDKVSIRPGITILSVLKHLNYKPYYALAEFVDNAIDSSLKNKDSLSKIEKGDFKLIVSIEFNTIDNTITIKDNAAGIHDNDFARAFRAAAIPPDRSLLSEFGMGMKSASCWFSNEWEVKTKAIGEDTEKTVKFNINDIVNDEIEELEISSKKTNLNSHYTIIKLLDVRDKMPVKRSLHKVKRHLTSIYREFIRNQQLELKINGTVLEYKTPKILKAPFHAQPHSPEGKSVFWKQEVNENFGVNSNGDKMQIKGFIALMDKMSVKDSGIALFRRGRVIEGSADTDEGFRPSTISGSLGSHRYKRLFGELHLEGFKVSHTKDGFQWDDNLDTFLELLREHLESKNSIPILKQADNYRVRPATKDLKDVSKKVVDNTTESISKNINEELKNVRTKEIHNFNENEIPFKESQESYHKTFDLELDDVIWRVHVELSFEDTISDLIEIGDHLIPNDINTSHAEIRHIGIRLSLIHRFMVNFAGDDKKVIEPLLRFTVALALGEVIARELDAPLSEIRNCMNELFDGSLAT